jgi:hypothetical protein
VVRGSRWRASARNAIVGHKMCNDHTLAEGRHMAIAGPGMRSALFWANAGHVPLAATTSEAPVQLIKSRRPILAFETGVVWTSGRMMHSSSHTAAVSAQHCEMHDVRQGYVAEYVIRTRIANKSARSQKRAAPPVCQISWGRVSPRALTVTSPRLPRLLR